MPTIQKCCLWLLLLFPMILRGQDSDPIQIARRLTRNNEHNKAVSFLEQQLNLMGRTSMDIKTGSVYLELADLLLLTNQTDSLEAYYGKAAAIFEQNGKTEELILAKTGALELQRRTNPSATMDLYRDLLNQARATPNRFVYYQVLDKIITVNYAMENYEDAIKLCHESIQFYQAQKDTLKLASKYRALANVYFSNNADSAMYYYNKALPLLYALPMYRYLVYTYQSMGWLTFKSDVDEGLVYLYKADSIDKKYHIESPQLPLVYSFALAKRKDYSGAILMARESMRRGIKNKQLFIALQSSDALSDYFKQQHLYDSALFYKEQSAIINDSIRSQKHYRDAVKMQTSLEYEKAMFEKELLSKEQNKRQQLIMGFSLAGIILLLIIVVLIYLAFRKSKQNEKLFAKKNHEKEILLAEIHHRVKNNLAIVSGILDLQLYKTKDPEQKDIFKDAKARINSMLLVHKNLYEQEDFVQIDTQQYFESLYQNIASLYHNQETAIKAEIVCKDVSINLDTLIPLALIANELLTNTFKYAFKDMGDGQISLELSSQKNGYAFRYADTGVGMENTQLVKKGMGSMLIEGLVKQIKGKLTLESTSIGLSYYITFQGIAGTTGN